MITKNVKRLQEIEERKAEITKLINTDNKADIDALTKEVSELNNEVVEIRKQDKLVETLNKKEDTNE